MWTANGPAVASQSLVTSLTLIWTATTTSCRMALQTRWVSTSMCSSTVPRGIKIFFGQVTRSKPSIVLIEILLSIKCALTVRRRDPPFHWIAPLTAAQPTTVKLSYIPETNSSLVKWEISLALRDSKLKTTTSKLFAEVRTVFFHRPPAWKYPLCTTKSRAPP